MSPTLYIILFLSAFLPLFELRLTIPLGVLLLGEPAYLVVPVAVIANIVAGIVAYALVDVFILLARKSAFVDRIYQRYVLKVQKKIHLKIERWGFLGLALFIGIPLPVSGVYTGAFGARILGMDFMQFLIASIVGVCIAALAVLLVTLFLQELLVVIGFNEHTVELFRSLFGL